MANLYVTYILPHSKDEGLAQPLLFFALLPFLSAQSTDNAHIGTGNNQTAGGDKHEDERQHIKDERENQDPCRHEQRYHPKWTPPRFLRIREN